MKQSEWTSCDDHTQSILIVDDDENILEICTAAFEMHGLKVFTADNGLVAWDIFNSESVDVVLTDICMPKLNGKELSARIRNKSPDTTIAVITGGDEDVGHDLIENGTADLFFRKPFALSSVCKTIINRAQSGKVPSTCNHC